MALQPLRTKGLSVPHLFRRLPNLQRLNGIEYRIEIATIISKTKPARKQKQLNKNNKKKNVLHRRFSNRPKFEKNAQSSKRIKV